MGDMLRLSTIKIYIYNLNIPWAVSQFSLLHESVGVGWVGESLAGDTHNFNWFSPPHRTPVSSS